MDLELRIHFSVWVVKSLNFICDLALVQERHHGPWSHLLGCDVVSWLKGWNGSGYGQAFLLSLKLREGYLGCHVGTVYGRGQMELFIARASFLPCRRCWVRLFQHLVLMLWQRGHISRKITHSSSAGYWPVRKYHKELLAW